MNENTWYDTFLENLYERFPKKAQLTQEMMDLLFLEREAVYRRLRKEVFFTAHEIVKIAATWHISLDEIIGINSGKVPFQMNPLHYLSPSDEEIKNLQGRIDILEHIETIFESEFMEVSNRLPRALSIDFLALYRFKIFNWAYQYNDDDEFKLFSKIVIPDEIYQQFVRYSKIMKQVTNTHIILDEQVFERLVHDILYFHSILLITDEEKELLKKEINELLDRMVKIANKGCYPETLNKVNIYVSQINIDTNYSYFYTDQLKTCRVHAFGKYDISSFDPEMVNNFKNWMYLKKRTSMQISEANEKNRIEFFLKQRKIVDLL